MSERELIEALNAERAAREKAERERDEARKRADDNWTSALKEQDGRLAAVKERDVLRAECNREREAADRNLARAEQAERERDEAIDRLDCTARVLTRERDALRAEVEALRKQGAAPILTRDDMIRPMTPDQYADKVCAFIRLLGPVTLRAAEAEARKGGEEADRG